MKQKIWKNKKGAIPIITDLVQPILQILPKPVLLLLFILLITVLGAFLIPMILNLVGYECLRENGELVLYQVPMDNLLAKSISDARQTVRETVGLPDYQLPDDPFPNGDKRFLRIPEQCMKNPTINGTTVTGYSARCVNCTYEPFYWYSFLIGLDNNRICTSDGYANVLSGSVSLEYRQFCYICAPPNPYFYNHTLCLNNPNGCYFQLLSGYSPTDVLESYDYYLIRVKQLGGVIRPQDSTELINIQCKEYDKPSLYVFDIELFNKTMWIILIVGFGLVSFAFAWYGVILK